MKQVKIGNTNWQTSAVALGVMRMGTIEPKQAADAIDTAYENGINFIDSADIYGRGKKDENRLFRFILASSTRSIDGTRRGQGCL